MDKLPGFHLVIVRRAKSLDPALAMAAFDAWARDYVRTRGGGAPPVFYSHSCRVLWSHYSDANYQDLPSAQRWPIPGDYAYELAFTGHEPTDGSGPTIVDGDAAFAAIEGLRLLILDQIYATWPPPDPGTTRIKLWL